MRVYKTKSGYYYKQYKNGVKKKNIKKIQKNKKNQKTKRMVK